MRSPPINTIALEVIKAWKIIAAIYVSILWILTAFLIVLYFIFTLLYLYSTLLVDYDLFGDKWAVHVFIRHVTT